MSKVSGFRKRLYLSIILVVGLITVFGAAISHKELTRLSEQDFITSIDRSVVAVLHARSVRQQVLADICYDLSRQPRIHAALEDDALDLLYPSATNELRQVMQRHVSNGTEQIDSNLRAVFYRFLDLNGKVINPEDNDAHGKLPDGLADRLNLNELPDSQQVGYFIQKLSGETSSVIEVIAVPIISMESLTPISVLVVGFPFIISAESPKELSLISGIYADGLAVAVNTIPGDEELLLNEISSVLDNRQESEPFFVTISGSKYRIILKRINDGSLYPSSYGLFLSSMEPLQLTKARLSRGIVLISVLFLAIGLTLAHFASSKLARPVEELAIASREERDHRISAQTALDSTSRDLERAARFSADASHQLKTPVAVIRAGLEELLVDTSLPPSLQDEVRSMIRQTGRLTRVIEDLLLLSRLDSGRLEIDLQPVDLRLLFEGLLDDLSILPENEQYSLDLDLSGTSMVLGNKTYTSIILQNLLENARKYNRPKGWIRIRTEKSGNHIDCRICNSGKGIHPDLHSMIFNRFHRGSTGENVTGYGLGLNLALELVKLHHGKLLLLESREDWTEFQLILNCPESGA